jgi:hypothetical protein
MPTTAPSPWSPVARLLVAAVGAGVAASAVAAAPPTAPAAAPAPSPGIAPPPPAPDAVATKPAPTNGWTAQAIVEPEGTSTDGRLYFAIRNAAADPLRITGITVLHAAVISGSATAALPPPPALLHCGGDPAARPLPHAIAGFTTCIVSTALPVRGPGRYVADVAVQGGGGDGQTIRLQSDVRLDRSWAVWWVVAGLGSGCLVAWWSGSGRTRWTDAALVKAHLERLQLLAAGAGPARRLGAITAAAEDLQARLLGGGDYSAEEIGECGRRVRFARHLFDREQMAGAATPAVAAATTAALALLNPGADLRFAPPVDGAKVDAAAEAIAAAAGGPEAAAARAFPLPVSPTLSSASLRGAGLTLELVVAGIVALVFAALALQTFYDPDPHWGSFGDQFAAFMIGFGVFAGAVAGVDAILARVKPGAKPA